MTKISLAALAAALLVGGPALAQTTGEGLAPPRNVQPSAPASDASNGPNGAAPAPEANPDPWEGFNRRSYAFSMALDRAVIGPAARTYKRVLPQPIRTGLHNFVQNLSEPVVAINDVLQLRVKSAAGTVVRFVGNSTLGVGGLIDVTAKSGLPHHDNGFGVTLGRYGVKSGPYVYLPVLGPTTVRDGIGSGVDSFSNPISYVRWDGQTALNVGSAVVGGLDLRANVDDDLRQLQTTATDPYATIRSAYLQNKEAQISGGDTQLQSLPDFPDSPDQGAGPARSPSAGRNADPFAPSAPRGRSRRLSPGRAPAPQALPDFPDNPPNPPPPADAPGGLAGLY